MNRMLSGGMGQGRLSVEIRGEDLVQANRLALDVQTLMQATPGVADARVGRDVGRPELSIRVDRPKAALFGLGVTSIANTIRTNVAGTQAAMFRQAGNEYPIIVRLREADREHITDVNDVLVSERAGTGASSQEPDERRHGDRTRPDPAEEPAAHHHRRRRA